MELNGLLSMFLLELGYQVTRVPAYVYRGHELGYIPMSTHIVLIVQTTTPQQKDQDDGATPNTRWLVDVGFGEPALHPLRYELHTEQRTPEGMISRFVMHEPPPTTNVENNKDSSESQQGNQEDDEAYVELQYKLGSEWMPRLKWKQADAMNEEGGASMEDFAPAMKATLDASSIFSQKLICCRLTRDEKITLAGNKLKKTGPPRFANGDDDQNTTTKVDITELTSIQQVRQVLLDELGIPWEETKELDLSRSLQADPAIWAQL
jgi:arylamine N-acetyltransferase